MIPEFPVFKKIEITDKQEIENFTKDFPPYSDFNFVTLFCWDVDGKRRVSWLNGNLVILLTNDISGGAFLSFLGNNLVMDTISILLNYAKKNKISRTLRMIPEECVSYCVKNVFDFKIGDDRNNFDYVYSVDELANLRGNRFARIRNATRKFERTFEKRFKVDVSRENNQDSINKMLLVLDTWNSVKESYESREKKALSRLFEFKNEFELIYTIVSVDDKPVAFTISQVCGSGYAIGHFGKADFEYCGVYSFLIRETSKELSRIGCKLFNMEEDMGLGQLRRTKELYRPVSFMRKYNIENYGIVKKILSMLEY